MPGPTKQKPNPASSQRKKGSDETHGEKETADQTPKAQRSSNRLMNTSHEDSISQPTIDKHFKLTEGAGDADTLNETIRAFAEKLDKVASQEYLEKKLKDIITEEFLSKKLKDLEKELKSQYKKEIDKVYKQVGELKDRMAAAESTVETLRNNVSDMESSMENIQKENADIVEQNKAMKATLQEREALLQVQSGQINDLEQYTRKNSVRIYGVDDSNPKETANDTAKCVLKALNEKLELRLTTADIDITHRMGRFKTDGNRPIICKFVSRYTKQEVIKARRMLKGTPLVIREDLTLQNAKLLEKTQAMDCVRAAWSDDGKIIALLNNDRKVIVDRKTNVNSLISRD